jgi:UDP-N-acetylglucosamine acyltransferase
MNFEGLRRRGFSAEAIAALRRAYKIVYRQGLTVEQALIELADSSAEFPEIAVFRDSIQASKRGITR